MFDKSLLLFSILLDLNVIDTMKMMDCMSPVWKNEALKKS